MAGRKNDIINWVLGGFWIMTGGMEFKLGGKLMRNIHLATRNHEKVSSLISFLCFFVFSLFILFLARTGWEQEQEEGRDRIG
jgi:hypothetical protein